MKMCTAEFRRRTLRLPGSASNKANVDRFAANVLPVIERLRRAVSCDYVLPDHGGCPGAAVSSQVTNKAAPGSSSDGAHLANSLSSCGS